MSYMAAVLFTRVPTRLGSLPEKAAMQESSGTWLAGPSAQWLVDKCLRAMWEL
jgi:hypothetical protein